MYSSFKLIPCLGGVCRNLCSSISAGKPLASVRHYRQRRNLFSELSSAIQNIESRMKEMDRELDVEMEREMEVDREINKIFNDLQRESLSRFDWGRAKEEPVVSNAHTLELDMQGMLPLARMRPYRQRRNLFSELSSALQNIESCMKEMDREREIDEDVDMDREISKIFNDLQRKSLSRFVWGRAKEVPVVSNDGSDRTYTLELDMQGMQPEDLNISLKGNELTIFSRSEEKCPDGSQFVRENKYQYTLPKEVNPDTLRSVLSEGVLTIEAPLPAIEAKELPIKIESSGSGM